MCVQSTLQGSLITWAYGSELSSSTHPPSQEGDYFSSCAGHRVVQETRWIQQNQNLSCKQQVALVSWQVSGVYEQKALHSVYVNTLNETGFTVKP